MTFCKDFLSIYPSSSVTKFYTIMVLEKLPSGAGGRWALGAVVFTHVIAYNEIGATAATFAICIAAICAVFSAICKSSLSNLQLPYLRATHQFDFLCLFLALWLDILSLICACSALARTISICLDAMSGGMARIYILGRNSPTNEPWPDLLGFSVVFLISGMFMLGLENSKVFWYIMTAGVIGVGSILFGIAWIRGNLDSWRKESIFDKGWNKLLNGSAMFVFSYSPELPFTLSCRRGCGMILIAIGCLFNILLTGCLSTVSQFSAKNEYVAVPILSILDIKDFHKVEPAIACLLLLACCGAFLELFSEIIHTIVRFTTSDWKILSRQIGYEDGDSGSPVLAVFIAGSLCATAAFACPLQYMINVISISHLWSGLLRSYYLLYSPFRPKYTINNPNNSSQAYQRLESNHTEKPAPTIALNTASRSTWFFKKPQSAPIPKSKSRNNVIPDEEPEREWLLLGEPHSPRNTQTLDDSHTMIDTSILTVSEPLPGGSDVFEEEESTDSDISTDIDAVVDEYRQKFKVTTAGPSEKIMQVPSSESWHISIACIICGTIGVLLAGYGLIMGSGLAIFAGFTVVGLINVALVFLPKYSHCTTTPSFLMCFSSISIHGLLLASTISYSWLAIICWILAGTLIFTRCEKWCCREPLRPRVLSTTSSNYVTSIRMPRPPKGAIIESRICPIYSSDSNSNGHDEEETTEEWTE